MIWIRRLISVPLVLVLLVLLAVSLLLFEINDTFLNPSYYPDEFEEADFYEFLLVDLLTAGLDDARELRPQDTEGGLDQNPLVTSGLSTDDIVASVNSMVPPDWVQTKVREAFEQFGAYFTGDEDTFEFTINTSDRIRAVSDELVALLEKADVYNLLFEEFATPVIRDAVDVKLPFGVQVGSDRLIQAARQIAPADWVQNHIERAILEFTAYIVSDQDHFDFTIPLSDRIEIALREIKAILREADAYDLLYDEVIGPILTPLLGGGVDLPMGFTIQDSEILAILKEAAPPDWVEEQAETVIDEAGQYMTGKTDRFVVDVSLEDNKRRATVAIQETAESKLNDLVSTVGDCGSDLTVTDLLAMQQDIAAGGLPSCLPAGTDRDLILDAVNEQVALQVDSLVLNAIPDSISYSSDDMRQALVDVGAVDNVDTIDDIRELLRDGWTYTDVDLRSDIATHLDEDDVGSFDEIREFLSGSWTYTHQDLIEDSEDFRPGGSADDARKWFGRARTFRFLVFLPTILLAIAIGFLSGRGWWGRLAWGSGAVVLTSAIIFILTGPAFGAFKDSGYVKDNVVEFRDDVTNEVRDALDKRTDTVGSFATTSDLVADKLEEIAWSTVDRQASGLSQTSLIILIVSAVALGSAAILPRVLAQRRRPL